MTTFLAMFALIVGLFVWVWAMFELSDAAQRRFGDFAGMLTCALMFAAPFALAIAVHP